MPQLRILVTNFCSAKCIYCKPLGEGNSKIEEMSFIELAEVIKIAEIYKRHGGREIKITGGEPVFWPRLIESVGKLKKDLGINVVEVIMCSTKKLDSGRLILVSIS